MLRPILCAALAVLFAFEATAGEGHWSELPPRKDWCDYQEATLILMPWRELHDKCKSFNPEAALPDATIAGCYNPETDTLYLPRMADLFNLRLVLHELGHDCDAQEGRFRGHEGWRR